MKDIILVFLVIIFAIFIFWYLYKIDFGNITEGNMTQTNNPVSIISKRTQRPTVVEMGYIVSIVDHSSLNASEKVDKLKLAGGISLIKGVVDILNNTTDYAEGQEGDLDKLNEIANIIDSQELNKTYDDLIVYYPLSTLESGGNVYNKSNEIDSFGDPIWEGDPDYNGKIYNGTLDNKDIKGSGNATIKFTARDSDCTSAQGGTFIKINKLPSFYEDGTFTGFSILFWAKIDNINQTGTLHYPRFFDFALSTEGNKEFAYYNHNFFATYANPYNDMVCVNAVGPDPGPAKWNGIWSNSKVRDNKWRHYAFIMDEKGAITYYIDGNLVMGDYIKSDTNMVDKDKRTYPWGDKPAIPNNVERDLCYIGRSNFHWDSYFAGNMADFRIYSKPIKQETILSILKIQKKELNTNALLNMGGGFFGNGISFNFVLNGNKDSRSVFMDNNNRLIWKSQHGNTSINGIASSNNFEYCSKTGRITIPAKQYMTITPSNGSNFGAPFTIFVVADMKSFKGFKTLFGSNTIDGFEIHIDYQYDMYIGKAGVGGKFIQFNSGASLNPTQVDGKGINIFTITCDATGAFKFYLNSKHFGAFDGDKLNTPPINGGITLGATVVFNNVYSSPDTDLDYYNFMHFTGVLPDDWRPIYELYFACKYDIKKKLEGNNIYLDKHKSNFNNFPF